MIGMEANKIAITDEALRRGAEEGMDGFLKGFIEIPRGDRGCCQCGNNAFAQWLPAFIVGVSFLA